MDSKVTVDVVGDDPNCTWNIVKVAATPVNPSEDTPSLRVSDNTSKAVQKTPWRVSLDAMKRRVVSVEYLFPHSIPHMTIAVVILDNGYALQGKSAPADPANFNEDTGKQYAYEDAMRQLWALEAYVMRDYLCGTIVTDDKEAAKRWGA
jgi:hypothetical protein